MNKFYRTMRPDENGFPQVGRSARMLGVRVEGKFADVFPDAQGRVLPLAGGMSVTVDDPAEMPVARRPIWLRQGASEDPLFVIEASRIVPPLAARLEVGAHALLEPVGPILLGTYEADLAATRSDWRRESGPREEGR